MGEVRDPYETEMDHVGAIKEEKKIGPKDRKWSWARLQRVDSLNLEAGRVTMSTHGHPQPNSKTSWLRTFSLAFQTIGVVYGDIGTSPLYVFSSTFSTVNDTRDVIGVLSLIIYTLILLPMIKYVFIVLQANDNGDGGTFALYSLICRHVKVGLIPNQQPEDRMLSNYNLEIPSRRMNRSEKVKEKLERSMVAKIIIFLVTIMGTSMVIGDGVLTPCISVLSAVSGINQLSLHKQVLVSCGILVLLFMVQRFGTDKVGFSFAPIIMIWFMFISMIGLYNLFKHDITVLRAFNPYYIVDYFKRNGHRGWTSLGGIFLCITGTEAMFADLGHFSVPAIQLSFSFIVFPALLMAYSGQAAYLMKFPQNVSNTFYDCIPSPFYWPTFVIAIMAAIIASQAMISGAFAIISQSLRLGCFPRVKVIHTSAKYEGQVFIPEVNYTLMIACVIVTLAFGNSTKIGNAYGVAVVSVMLITTCLLTLIMLVIWKTRIWWIALFMLGFGSIEILYLSANLYKFVKGGWFPIVSAIVLTIIMVVWHYAYRERYLYELKNKVASEYVQDLAKNPGINRIPGMALLYTELVEGVPQILPHFVSNVSSIHSVIVIVSLKNLPISKVVLEERFLFRQVNPKEFRMFRCVVRYGYNDEMEGPTEFERHLLERLKDFIRNEQLLIEVAESDTPVNRSGPLVPSRKDNRVHIDESLQQPQDRVSSSASIRSVATTTGQQEQATVEEEIKFVEAAMDHGVVYLLGEAEVMAKPGSSILKKIVVNYMYSFLRKNFRQGEKMMAIPRGKILRVGMTYEGMVLLYSDIVEGIRPIFSHFVSNVSLIHSVMVVLSIRTLPICKVALEKRFLFWRVEPREPSMFGLGTGTTTIKETNEFKRQLIENLKEIIGNRQLFFETKNDTPTNKAEDDGRVDAQVNAVEAEEMGFVQTAVEKGVIYMLGEAEVVEKPSSSFNKKFVVNHAYGFLWRNFRSGEEITAVPRSKIVRVGMTYEI